MGAPWQLQPWQAAPTLPRRPHRRAGTARGAAPSHSYASHHNRRSVTRGGPRRRGPGVAENTHPTVGHCPPPPKYPRCWAGKWREMSVHCRRRRARQRTAGSERRGAIRVALQPHWRGVAALRHHHPQMRATLGDAGLPEASPAGAPSSAGAWARNAAERSIRSLHTTGPAPETRLRAHDEHSRKQVCGRGQRKGGGQAAAVDRGLPAWPRPPSSHTHSLQTCPNW
jgi:hypothetical protein